VITVPLQYVSIVGRNALLLIFVGRSFAEFIDAVGLGGSGVERWSVPIATVLVCALGFMVLVRGATGLERLAMVLLRGPARLMTGMGGSVFGGLALLFVIVANLGAVTAGGCTPRPSA
jgi:hypothetical protein